ncbi:MAG: hypothetical protein JWR52_657 [Marmoricola sp.]|nr:hypothetical protein [Marmoricola sp.]
MIKRLLVVTSFGAGYVAGAAAGRERYEQIRRIALRIKDDPHVQQALDDAADFAMHHDHSAAEPFVPSQGARVGQ